MKRLFAISSLIMTCLLAPASLSRAEADAPLELRLEGPYISSTIGGPPSPPYPGGVGPLYTLLSSQPLPRKELSSFLELYCGGKKIAFSIKEKPKNPSVLDVVLDLPEGESIPVWTTDQSNPPSRTVFKERHTLILKEPIPPDSAVELRVKPGLRPVGASASLGALTVPGNGWESLRLKGVSIDYEKVFERGVPTGLEPLPADAEATIRLEFNHPVSGREVLDHLAFEPKAVVGGFSSPGLSSEYHDIKAGLTPNTDYTLTLKSGLSDLCGYRIAEDVSFNFRSGDFAPAIAFPARFYEHINDGPARDLLLDPDTGGRLPILLRSVPDIRYRLSFVPLSDEFLRLLPSASPDSVGVFLNLPGYADFSFHPEFEFVKNAWAHPVIDLPKLLDKKPGPLGGLIFLAPEKAGAGAALRTRAVLTQVSDLGLTVRAGPNGGLIWVTSLTSGAPKAGVDLRLYSREREPLWEGKSDANGLALVPALTSKDMLTTEYITSLTREYHEEYDSHVGGFVLIASEGRDRALFSPEPNTEHRPPGKWRRPFVLAQSPVYQPGQTVNAVLFLKEFGQDDWGPAAGVRFSYRVFQWATTLSSGIGEIGPYGSFPFSFTLPEDALPGACLLEIVYEDSAIAQFVGDWWGGFDGFTTVQAFNPSNFKVEVAGPQSGPRGKSPAVKVFAADVSGSPMKQSPLRLDLSLEQVPFHPESLHGYHVGLPDAGDRSHWPPWALRFGRMSLRYETEKMEKVKTLTAVLDHAGRAELELPVLEKLPGVSSDTALLCRLEAEVTSPGGLSGQGDVTWLVHPAEYYIGLKTRQQAGAGGGNTIAVDLKAATWDDKPVYGVKAVLTLVRKYSPDAILWRREVVLREPDTADSGTEPGGNASLSFTIDESDSYDLTAEISDSSGRTQRTLLEMYFSPCDLSEDKVLTDAAARQEVRDLALRVVPKSFSAPGTACILVENLPEIGRGKSAAPGDERKLHYLLSLERGGVVRCISGVLDPDSPYIDVPLEAGDAPYVFAHLSLTRGRIAPPAPLLAPAYVNEVLYPARATKAPVFYKDPNGPIFASGSLRLLVESADAALPPRLTVTPDKTSAKSGDLVRVKVRCERPGKRRITFMAVDQRLIKAAGLPPGNEYLLYNPGDGRSGSYQGEGYYFDRFTGHDNRKNLLALGWFHLSGQPYNGGYITHCGPGLKREIFNPHARSAGQHAGLTITARERLPEAAFWLPEAETDAAGELDLAFTLPHSSSDAQTSYSLIAVTSADGPDFSVGSGVIVIRD